MPHAQFTIPRDAVLPDQPLPTASAVDAAPRPAVRVTGPFLALVRATFRSHVAGIVGNQTLAERVVQASWPYLASQIGLSYRRGMLHGAAGRLKPKAQVQLATVTSASSRPSAGALRGSAVNMRSRWRSLGLTK